MGKKASDLDPIALACVIIKNLHVHRLSEGSNPQLISYDSGSGLYVLGDLPIEFQAQIEWVRGDFEDPIKDYHVREILKAVRRNTPSIEAQEINDSKRQIVVFRNGVLNLTTMKLEKHSPERWGPSPMPSYPCPPTWKEWSDYE